MIFNPWDVEQQTVLDKKVCDETLAFFERSEETILSELVQTLCDDLETFIANSAKALSEIREKAAEKNAKLETQIYSNDIGMGESEAVDESADTGKIDADLYAQFAPQFPGTTSYETCGRIACLYPIKRSLLLQTVQQCRVNDETQADRVKQILGRWLCEVYGEDSGDVRCGEGVECNGCKRNISVCHIRMRCLECIDYDLCEKCLLANVETVNHERNHIYFLSFPGKYSLFDTEWSAAEEIVLLEAIGKYGLGNWAEVAEWLLLVTPPSAGDRSKEDCEARYYQLSTLCDPSRTKPICRFLYRYAELAMSTVLQKRSATESKLLTADYEPLYNSFGIDIVRSSLFRAMQRSVYKTPEEQNTDKDAAEASDPDLCKVGTPSELYCMETLGDELESAVALDTSLDENGNAAEMAFDPAEYEMPAPTMCCKFQAMRPPSNQNNKVVISGYLSYRGDLEVEWKNNAELNICDFNIFPEDTPIEKQSKLLALEAYNCVLDDRWIRKRIYIDRKLWDQKGKPPNDSIETVEHLKPLWRYVYPNYCYQDSTLFLQQHDQEARETWAPNELSDEDMSKLGQFFSSERMLRYRLNLLTAWHENGYNSIEKLVQGGAEAARAISKSTLFTPPIVLEASGFENLQAFLAESSGLTNAENTAFKEQLAMHLANTESFAEGLKPQFSIDFNQLVPSQHTFASDETNGMAT